MSTQKRRNRQPLTPETILSKDRYRVIAALLSLYGRDDRGMRRADLAFYLIRSVSRSKKKLTPVTSHTQKRILKRLDVIYENEVKERDGRFKRDYDKFRKRAIMNPVETLLRSNYITEDAFFEDIYQMRHALTTLRRLGLVTSMKPKKGYSTLQLTEKGRMQHSIQWIQYMLKEVDDWMTMFRIEDFIRRQVYKI